MKYTTRTLTFLICLWICAAVLVGTVSAQTETPLRLQRTNALSELMADYEARSPSIGSTVKGILRHYRDKVENLPLQADGWTVDAYYYQGVCAGTLAWIYYSHPEVHPLGSQDADSHPIYSLYQAELAILSSYEYGTYSDDALQAFFLGEAGATASVERCYTNLLNSIYAHKVRLLKKIGDSEATVQILEAAALRLEDPARLPSDQREDPLNPTPSFEREDAENYKTYFAYVSARVAEQRCRDDVSAELIGIYRVLYPDVSFSSLSDLQDRHSCIDEFVRILPTKSTLSEIHSLLGSTIRSLLYEVAASKDFYTASYLQNTLLTKISTTLSSATVEGRTVELIDSCFGTRYRLDYARADAKDKLCAEADRLGALPSDKHAILTALLQEYTDEASSHFNPCTTPEEVAAQLAHGQTRLSWLGEYLSAIQTLTASFANQLTDAQMHTLSARLDAQYAQTDTALVEGDAQALPVGRAAMADILCDAEIDAFYHRHPIVSNLPASATKEDKPLLGVAIDNAATLSSSALQKAELCTRLERLCQAYQSAILDEIYSLLISCTHAAPTHTDLNRLIRSTQDTLATAVRMQSPQSASGTWSFRNFLNNTATLTEKAILLKNLFAYYHDEILSLAPVYYTAQLQSVCEDGTQAILQAEQSESQNLNPTLSALDRLTVLETIRTAAEEHSDTMGIRELLSQAEESLLPNAAHPPADLFEYRTDLLFRIENCVLAEELEEQMRDLDTALDQLTFLAEEEREYYHSLSQDLQEHVNTIRNAQSKEQEQTVVAQNKQAFSDSLERILSDAKAQNLQIEKENAKDTFQETADSLVEQINGYPFLSQTHRDELLAQIGTIQSQTESNIDAALDSDGIELALFESESLLDSLSADADAKERSDCLLSLKAELECYQNAPEEYSAENMVQIQGIVLKTLSELDQTELVNDLLTVFRAAKEELDAIPTRLDEARAEELVRLQEVYDALLQRKDWYAPSALATLSEQYEAAKSLIADQTRYQKASDIEALRAAVLQSILALRSIKLDRLETEKSSPVQGAIHSSGAIPYNSTLTIGESFVQLSDLQKQIRKAVREHRIRTAAGEAPDKTLQSLLRSCMITSVLRFELEGDSLVDGAVYSVSFRLSEAIDRSELLGILYRNENGELEFYEITQTDTTLTFSTTHFSEYYLVSAKVVHLTPVMILLGIFVLFEIAILILLYRRRAHRAAGSQAMAMGFVGLSVRYRPHGGITAVVILGIAAVGLAAWIVALLIAEYRLRKPKPIAKEIEETIPIPVLALAEVNASHTLTQAPDVPPLEILSEVTAEVAETMMSDECAREQVQSEEEQRDDRIYHGSKRATINLDTISANFHEGETVTLNDLKACKLIGENVGFVKILARGRLDKSLTILAQDFSMSAIKMILLTGGTAIRTHQSVERQKAKP